MSAVCVHCRTRFDPLTSFGRWECRYHPSKTALPRSPLVPYPCCGWTRQRVTEAERRDGTLPDYFIAYVSAKDAQGCVACAHVSSWADATPALVAIVAQWRLSAETIASPAIVGRFDTTLSELVQADDARFRLVLDVAYPPSTKATVNVRDAVLAMVKREYRDPAFYAWYAANTTPDAPARVQKLKENVHALIKRAQASNGDMLVDAVSEEDSAFYEQLGKYLESSAGASHQLRLVMFVVRQVAPAQDAETLYRMHNLNAAYHH